MNYRNKIRKAIECPQFKNSQYREWGVLTLKQRSLIKRLLDEFDDADNYIIKIKQQNEFLMKQDNILQTLIQWLYKQIKELENIPKDEEMSIEAYGRLNAYRIVLMKIKELKEDLK